MKMIKEKDKISGGWKTVKSKEDGIGRIRAWTQYREHSPMWPMPIAQSLYDRYIGRYKGEDPWGTTGLYLNNSRSNDVGVDGANGSKPTMAGKCKICRIPVSIQGSARIPSAIEHLMLNHPMEYAAMMYESHTVRHNKIMNFTSVPPNSSRLQTARDQRVLAEYWKSVIVELQDQGLKWGESAHEIDANTMTPCTADCTRLMPKGSMGHDMDSPSEWRRRLGMGSNRIYGNTEHYIPARVAKMMSIMAGFSRGE
tara:strand:+ start:947 stop:1708 length:762 start_codon:yes stop_codon:yes gene_type:complete